MDNTHKHMTTIEKKLNELLVQIKRNIGEIPGEIEAAYTNTPRHLFVDKILDKNDEGEIVEIELTKDNIDQYLAEIYSDRPIALIVDAHGKGISTISQPTIVLSMLKKLNLKQGQKVLEIGTASGWNAAMMAKIVEKKGHVYSIDIVPELIVRARLRIKEQGITNLSIFNGDGAIAKYGESFDRIIFTTGSYDIPESIHNQLSENGLLLMVIKNRGLYDCLVLFRKTGNHLESIESSPCKFVPLTGQYSMPELDSIRLESLPIWERLKDQVVYEQPFWWGTNAMTNDNSKIMGITSFLGIVEPQFEIFKVEENRLCFGLIDHENSSIVIWGNDKLIGYGNEKALCKIKAAFELYLSLGMPGATCFNLQVYSKDQNIKLHENQWLISRRDSHFVWSLGK